MKADVAAATSSHTDAPLEVSWWKQEAVAHERLRLPQWLGPLAVRQCGEPAMPEQMGLALHCCPGGVPGAWRRRRLRLCLGPAASQITPCATAFDVDLPLLMFQTKQ